MNSKATHRVVIVGAGFGGLNAAQSLAGADVKITVIDRQNFHTFQPLLYQVATAGLSPGEIAEPIRSILRKHRNIEVLMAEVTGFDLERRLVRAGDLEVPYDSLIVAAGASHAYFGHDEWKDLAPGLKTIEDAIEIRRRVLLAFELAEREASAGEGRRTAEFCGGGRRADGSGAGGNFGGDLPACAGAGFPKDRSAKNAYSSGGRRAECAAGVSARSFAKRAGATATAGRGSDDLGDGHAD